MDSAFQTSNAPNEGALVGLGRSLGRSRIGQVFCATGVAAFFFGLASVAWLHSEFSAIMVAVWLANYGLFAAWRILPISASTRARWAKEEQLAKGRLLFQYQTFFICGIVILASDLLHPVNGVGVGRSYDFMFPGFFFVWAAVSFVSFRRFVRKTQTATGGEAGP